MNDKDKYDEPMEYLAQRAAENESAKQYIDQADEQEYIEEQFDLCDPLLAWIPTEEEMEEMARRFCEDYDI